MKMKANNNTNKYDMAVSSSSSSSIIQSTTSTSLSIPLDNNSTVTSHLSKKRSNNSDNNHSDENLIATQPTLLPKPGEHISLLKMAQMQKSRSATPEDLQLYNPNVKLRKNETRKLE